MTKSDRTSRYADKLQLLDKSANAYNKIKKTLSPEQILLLDKAIDAAVEYAVICYGPNIVGQ